MEDGTVFTIGAGWALPPGYPHFSTTTIEFVATEGALLIDDTHRDVVLNTLNRGMVLPLSTMPGEQVGHVYQGPMEAGDNSLYRVGGTGASGGGEPPSRRGKSWK